MFDFVDLPFFPINGEEAIARLSQYGRGYDRCGERAPRAARMARFQLDQALGRGCTEDGRQLQPGLATSARFADAVLNASLIITIRIIITQRDGTGNLPGGCYPVTGRIQLAPIFFDSDDNLGWLVRVRANVADDKSVSSRA